MVDSMTMIFLALLLSIDGALISFLLGSKRIQIEFPSFLLLSIVAGIVMFIAMILGKFAGEFLSPKSIQILAGTILILIGISQFSPQPSLYHQRILIMLGVLINMDVFAYGLQAGMMEHSYVFCFFVAIILLAALIGGFILGCQVRANYFLMKFSSILPGVIFLALGILKIL